MFKISVCDKGLVVSDDKITAIIPPCQALKEGLWLIESGAIKTIKIKGTDGTEITLTDLSENDVKIIRNFIAENLV
jgi:hypothetical protein